MQSTAEPKMRSHDSQPELKKMLFEFQMEFNNACHAEISYGIFGYPWDQKQLKPKV